MLMLKAAAMFLNLLIFEGLALHSPSLQLLLLLLVSSSLDLVNLLVWSLETFLTTLTWSTTSPSLSPS